LFGCCWAGTSAFDVVPAPAPNPELNPEPNAGADVAPAPKAGVEAGAPKVPVPAVPAPKLNPPGCVAVPAGLAGVSVDAGPPNGDGAGCVFVLVPNVGIEGFR